MAEGISFDIVPAEKITIQEFLALGGFGYVYKGKHEEWGITVAVKVLQEPTGKHNQQDLIKEAKIMNDVRFDYILRLYGIYQKPEELGFRLGLVMEYMENGSLFSVTRHIRPLPRTLQFRILYEVALGMNYLHGLKPPVLHLDLKPSNILLDESFHVKLTDFGLSEWKKFSTRTKSSPSSLIGGTWPYMPPEAFGNLNYKPDEAYDNYSYGILMWSVLTGEEPYSNVLQFGSAITCLVQEGQRPDLSILPKDLPTEMNDLMQQCWSQDIGCRPHFRDCICQIREIFDFEVYKSEIQQDVRIVQDALSGKESSLESSDCCHHNKDLQHLERADDSDHCSGAASSSSCVQDLSEEDENKQIIEKMSNVEGVLDLLAESKVIKGAEYDVLKHRVVRSNTVQTTLNPMVKTAANIVGAFYDLFKNNPLE
ncbi:receptor-interacting serine/threonine-protein kinase 2-like [Protopterus annectens]|uniref:receptor-interacting serine/threonine-protein kinase 2-like n=1 Tax=Protopterus annectens TaxID=7888 RepID=UPI001CFAB3E0|nr:receptor-interacting serine/threonine-protein kinase 2-like [Protopterus annectens]